MLVSTSEEIYKSQVNNSRSKAQYSFSRAARFPSSQINENPNICYSYSSGLSHRAAGIGYGTKYDFTKEKQNTPAPDKYASHDSLGVTKSKSNAYTFGVSREKYAKQYVEGHFVADPSVPGPGTYSFQPTVGTGGIKYSFRPKTSAFDIISNDSKKVPGPGAYSKDSISIPGHSILSTIKSSPNIIISHNSLARFPKGKDEGVPGPGAYKTSGEFLAGYSLSQYKNQGSRKFSNSQREFFGKQNTATPGPGSYRLPSEFGYYESVNRKTVTMPKLNEKKKKV